MSAEEASKANRYKVSKFGRDRAVELHRKEVQEDPQYGRRVHELSGKRLLCHCKPDEKCHAQNIQELFRDLFQHATNRVWRTLRPKLRRDGPARANPCSSIPGTSRGGSAMGKVSAPREPGRLRIESIPSHLCGRSSLGCSCQRQSQCLLSSSCPNSLLDGTQSHRSRTASCESLETMSKGFSSAEVFTSNGLMVTGQTYQSTSDFWVGC